MGLGIHGAASLSVNCVPSASQLQATPLKIRLSPSPSHRTLVLPPSSRLKPPLPTLRISKNCRRRPRIAVCSSTSEAPDGSAPAPSSKEAIFDLKLPRRNLMVQFTCNACGERTQRTINRIAYERGTVFVQCAGCLVNHKLVDNLGLVVEYDLREELNAESTSSKED